MDIRNWLTPLTRKTGLAAGESKEKPSPKKSNATHDTPSPKLTPRSRRVKRTIIDSDDDDSTVSAAKTPSKRNVIASKKRAIVDSDSDDNYLPVAEAETKKGAAIAAKKKKIDIKEEKVEDATPEEFFASKKVSQSKKTVVKKIIPEKKNVVKTEEDFGIDDDIDDSVFAAIDLLSHEASIQPIMKKESKVLIAKSESKESPGKNKSKESPGKNKSKESPEKDKSRESPGKNKSKKAIIKGDLQDMKAKNEPISEPVGNLKKRGRDSEGDDMDDDWGTEIAKPVKKQPKKEIKEKDSKVKEKREEEKENEEDGQKGKKKTAFWMAKNRAPPQALGSKDIPVGAPNCLSGSTFVITGELESITRGDVQDLVKRYGGKITAAVTSKTSYVILGRDPGPAKIDLIKKHNTKTLDEDGFFDLIRTSPTKQDITEKNIITEKVIPKEIREITTTKAQLWVDKYKPTKYIEICGNKSPIQKIANWLKNWPQNLANDFKKKDNDDTAIFRAFLISGPPGIGKTTAAHLCANLENYSILEFNASDARSKRAMDDYVSEVIDNSSIFQFFTPDAPDISKGKSKASLNESIKNTVLIMDEVDGMSGGDRGGSQELIKLIKKTKIPIICICNDRQSPKIKTLATYCYDARFRRPDAATVRSRLMTIAHHEGLALTGNVIDELVAAARSDIRQVINILSTYKLHSNSLDYDGAKSLGKSSEKYIQLSVFEIIDKLMNSQSWNTLSLSDKIELYFHDYQLANLMVQENYIRLKPDLLNQRRAGQLVSPREMECRTIELFSKAADAISEGDLVDRQIHGTEQQWSLMPVHSAFSCVRPAYFMRGYIHGEYYKFPNWLGQNSKTGKCYRLLKEIQTHMRLRISGDKNEVRQTYLPGVMTSLYGPLLHNGQGAVNQVIAMMDEYYLTKDDFDAIGELELVANGRKATSGQISKEVKTAFTKTYNKNGHPTISKMTLDGVGGKKIIEVPDMEDVFLDDDFGGDVSQEENNEEDDKTISTDKLIKEKAVKSVKGKKANGSKTSAKAPSRKSKASSSKN